MRDSCPACKRTPVGRAEFLYYRPDGSRASLCKRKDDKCARLYQFSGATQISDAEGRRSASEIPALEVESPTQPEAGTVNAVLAPSLQSSLWEA